MLYEYLDNEFEGRIKDLENAASNEELWRDSESDEDISQMHGDSADTYRRMAEMLRRMKNDIPFLVERYGG